MSAAARVSHRVPPTAAWLPAGFAAAAVAAQIAYPLTPPGAARDRLTVATVIVFFTASVVHAALTRGVAFTARLLLVTAGGGLVVEAAGVATGVPFGAYHYNATLGWQAAGVPLVIPLAWTMMGYPAYVVGRRISTGRVTGPLAAGAALGTWDLFLDPQMVAAGHWTWAAGTGPAILGIPVGNFVAWFVVATVMMALLWRPPSAAEDAIDDRVPIALYLWTYASSVMAHALFFDLPGSALLGGVGMGVVVVLLVRSLRRAP